jgi:DNA mismatch repair protein MSH3
MEKEARHRKYADKLGRSMLTRNLVDDEQEAAEGAEDDDDEPAPRSKSGKRGKLTPMEEQYLKIKREHLDKIIAYQVGYKYRFFGEDARVAAKELNIMCIPGKLHFDNAPDPAFDRFASASFPIARLHVHVKRLITAGHKVGVVRQLETAALKAAGDNKNKVFERKLTDVYTKGTYVGQIDGEADHLQDTSGATGYFLCLTEEPEKGTGGNDEKVRFGIVAVQPATGSIIYDDFEDGFMRAELETHLLHINPCEYLLVGEISSGTRNLIKHVQFANSRLESIEKISAAESYSHISGFYAEKLSELDSGSQACTLEKVHQLSNRVTICLSSVIKHLVEFNLDHVFTLTSNFESFKKRTHMVLNGNTLMNLEIFTTDNDTQPTERGSLFWSLDRTKTKFGKRLLRSWVGRPLVDMQRLQARIDAVEELIESSGDPEKAGSLKRLLSYVKNDLEKTLLRISYRRASRPELLGFLQTMQRLSMDSQPSFNSALLTERLAKLPSILDCVNDYLGRFHAKAARADDKYGFFRDDFESEEITDTRLTLAGVEHELGEYLADAAKILGRKVEYTTVSGIEYLIEIENSKLSKVPASWIKISSTKKCSRFHPPEVVKLLRSRDENKERLASACDEAYTALLDEVATKSYQQLRDCIQALAHLDCLRSLAEVGARPGYTRPSFADSEHAQMAVSQARHPMVEQLLLDSYVPNDISLSSSGDEGASSALLITGPNMGGKSSYVRSVALVGVMAQLGSRVPAASATVSLLDAVHTRMGARDTLRASTFMVELAETSEILRMATPRSLLVLDELGRGTSTHDGMAVAEAVLRELVERRVLTLFITHYQDLARLERQCPGLRNVHMRFEETRAKGGEEEITFLYEVGEGVAHRSYG